jgi:exodeoxyribonuclease VII large subunit
MNLGANGFRVDFYPVSVEGKKAVLEIIRAIQYFNSSLNKYDMLVIVRGGGSLESLQAFNNEALSREVAGSYIPTLLGIGHEKDITLAALAADVMVSTPTATALVLRASWDEARGALAGTEKYLLQMYEGVLLAKEHKLETFSHTLITRLEQFLQRFQVLHQRFVQHIPRLQFQIKEIHQSFVRNSMVLERYYQQTLVATDAKIQEISETLKHYDPKRVLALGYSLIRKQGQILRSVEGVKNGDKLVLRLAKGRLDAQVTGVYNKQG